MTNNPQDDIIPPEPSMESQSDANELKSRLEWGEPAFTILDVRDRNEYNNSHIMGAMSMPMDELVDRAKASIDTNRDIYVYGESDAKTATAAQQLRSAGFVHVSELKGGLPVWEGVAGPTEGIVEASASMNEGIVGKSGSINASSIDYIEVCSVKDMGLPGDPSTDPPEKQR